MNGQIERIEHQRLPQETDRRRTLSGARERRGTLAQHLQRARAVLLLEMHLRQTAIAALGGGKLVDEVAEVVDLQSEHHDDRPERERDAHQPLEVLDAQALRDPLRAHTQDQVDTE